MTIFPLTQVPLTIPSCVLWLDAADSSTVTIATGVSSWRDKSGNGLNALQATGSLQPVYTQNVLNGLPGLYFDGADDFLSIADNPLLEFATGGYTMFVLCRYITVGLVAKFSKGNHASTDVGYSWTSTSMRGRTDSAVSYSSNSSYSANSNNILTFVQKSNGSDQEYYKDNASFATSIAAGGTTGTTTSFRIARSGGSSCCEMYAMEFVFYNRECTSSEITLINRYLSNKWGIAIS